MYEHFERLEETERKSILDACIEEFADHGYQQASTNAIVQRAGIPKGTLFYYFGSKKNLYLYLIEYAVRCFAEEMPLQHDESADLFERLLHRGRQRMEFVVRQPQLYRLFYNAFLGAPEEIQGELQKRYAGYLAATQESLIDGLDASKFRPGVIPAEAVDLVSLVLEGIYSRYLPRFRGAGAQQSLALIDQVAEEAGVYFDLLKRGLYTPQP